MTLTQAQIDWATSLVNDPEVYADQVERIVATREVGSDIFIIAIDNGNPPVVPLKQIVFKFIYSDDTHQDLIAYESKLLNADEVDAGDSRPPQFAAHLPAQYWGAIESEEWWAVEACSGDFCPC